MHQRRRIILLFGLGIVLPSLLLGYLAFRGIQNDRALVEKERLDATRRAADRVLRAVDDEISAIETALSKSVADQSGTSSVNMAASLEKLADTRPAGRADLLFTEFKRSSFPCRQSDICPRWLSPRRLLPAGQRKRFRRTSGSRAAGVPATRLPAGSRILWADSGTIERSASFWADLERRGQDPKEVRAFPGSHLDV